MVMESFILFRLFSVDLHDQLLMNSLEVISTCQEKILLLTNFIVSDRYFMNLIQQSGDTDLVNILQGSTAGMGNAGPNIFNPQNLLNITVLIPQQITGQQMGSSQDLSRVSRYNRKSQKRKIRFSFI